MIYENEEPEIYEFRCEQLSTISAQTITQHTHTLANVSVSSLYLYTCKFKCSNVVCICQSVSLSAGFCGAVKLGEVCIQMAQKTNLQICC